jgi:hypothetical protein
MGIMKGVIRMLRITKNIIYIVWFVWTLAINVLYGVAFIGEGWSFHHLRLGDLMSFLNMIINLMFITVLLTNAIINKKAKARKSN